MAEFIKVGNEITVKPKLEGLAYELIKGKVYDLKYNRIEGKSYLVENGDLNMPKKLYELEEDNKFIKRVLNYFNSENSGKTTGILLAGTKGTGKTMLSKRIALESNLPIIVVATDYPADKLSAFFKNFTTPVVIMFDEIEKNEYNLNLPRYITKVVKETAIDMEKGKARIREIEQELQEIENRIAIYRRELGL